MTTTDILAMLSIMGGIALFLFAARHEFWLNDDDEGR